MAEISLATNPVIENNHLVEGVFRTGRIPPKSRQNKITEQSPGIAASLPNTQLPSQQSSQLQEAWGKAGAPKRFKGGEKESESQQFVQLLLKTKNFVFQDWGLRPMASFFNENVLNDTGKSLNYSSLSKMFRYGKPVPTKTVCTRLRAYIENELPRRTVDIENDGAEFSIFPFARKRVECLVHSPTEFEVEPHCLVKFGDARVKLSDVKSLYRPDKWAGSSGSSVQFWITDEIVNCLTNLYSSIAPLRKTFHFNSIFVSLKHGTYFGNNPESEECRNERWIGL